MPRRTSPIVRSTNWTASKYRAKFFLNIDITGFSPKSYRPVEAS